MQNCSRKKCMYCIFPLLWYNHCGCEYGSHPLPYFWLKCSIHAFFCQKDKPVTVKRLCLFDRLLLTAFHWRGRVRSYALAWRRYAVEQPKGSKEHMLQRIAWPHANGEACSFLIQGRIFKHMWIEPERKRCCPHVGRYFSLWCPTKDTFTKWWSGVWKDPIEKPPALFSEQISKARWDDIKTELFTYQKSQGYWKPGRDK